MPSAEFVNKNEVGEPPPVTSENNRVYLLNTSEPDVLNPKPVAQPRRVYHVPLRNGSSTNSLRKKTFFDELFSGCCASKASQRTRSFMIVTEQPVNNNNEQDAQANVNVGENNQFLLEQVEGQAVIVDTNNSNNNTGSLRKVQPKTNGILKQSSSFQKGGNQRRSRGSNFYNRNTFPLFDDCATINCASNSNSLQKNRNRSRSSERLVNNSAHQASVVIHRASSPSSQSEIEIRSSTPLVQATGSSGLPGSCYNISSTNNYNQPIAAVTSQRHHQTPRAATLTRQRRSSLTTTNASAKQVLHPVEVHEIDSTPPSLDPLIITGNRGGNKTEQEDNSGMVNTSASYYSSNYYHQATMSNRPQVVTTSSNNNNINTSRRGRSRDRNYPVKTTSYYTLSDPEPIAGASATVRTNQRHQQSSNFARSQSYHHYSTSRSRSPDHHKQQGYYGTTLTAAVPNTVTINLARPPPQQVSNTNYHYRQNSSISRNRSPSPNAARVRVDSSPHQRQSRPFTYAPVLSGTSSRRGETISVNARCQQQRQQQTQYQTSNRVSYSPPPRQSLSRSPQRGTSEQVPAVPVGSKIDVTMRSRGQLVDDSASKRASSVRYTYETEFEAEASCDECEECNYYRRLQQQQPRQQKLPAPKEHHQNRHQQYSQNPPPGPTKVQVGDMVDEYRSVYHEVETNAVRRPPVQSANKVSVSDFDSDGTPFRGQTVVVTKQVKNNKRVLEALEASRKKLDQLDVDLDKALRRIQERNNRTETPAVRRSDNPKYALPPPTSLKSPSSKTAAYIPISSSADFTICAETASRRRSLETETVQRSSATQQYGPPPSKLPMGSNIVLITIADDGQEERFEENEQIIFSREPPVREVMIHEPPRRVQIAPPVFVPRRQEQTPTPPIEVPVRRRPNENENPNNYPPPDDDLCMPNRGRPVEKENNDELPPEDPCTPQRRRQVEIANPTPGPDQFDYTDKKNVAVVSPHGTIGNIFHQLTHGKLPDFVHQRFNVEHSEEEIHNDDIDLCHADGSNVGRLEGFQNLDTIYELINMGIENAQAKVCFKVTCQRIEPVNPRAGIWKRKSVTASRVLNIDLSQNDELRTVLKDIQSAPGESVRMIMSHDVDSDSNVTTREKQLDTPTTAWAVAEILGKTIDQQGAKPISPRSVEGGPLKFLSPSKFAEEVYNTDILGQNGKELTAVQFSTRRGAGAMSPPPSRPWTSHPPPPYQPDTVPSH